VLLRRSPCWCLPFFSLLLVLLSFPCSVVSQEARSLDAVGTDLATQLAQQFPKVSGEVVRVEGERIYLSLGAQDNILEHMRLSLFREGETITRPTTGEVLGRFEKTLGTVTVVKVFENYAVATLVEPVDKPSVQIGDRVRITAGRIALGVLPLVNQTRHVLPQDVLVKALQHALEATGRFRVVSQDRIAIWLLNRGVLPKGVIAPELLPQLAKDLQITYLLMPLGKNLQGVVALQLLLLSPTQPQTPVATASALLPRDVLVQKRPVPEALTAAQRPAPKPSTPAGQARTEPPASVQREPARQPDRSLWGVFETSPRQPTSPEQWNIAETLTRLQRLPGFLRGIDGGDIDADGKVEVVLATDDRISLYRLEGESLTPVSTYTVNRYGGTLVGVQLLSLGADKSVGVVVNQYVLGEGMDSFLLGLEGQRLVLRQNHLRNILLAVDADGDGMKESLWGQPFDEEEFFLAGQARRYLSADGRLERKTRLSLPRTFRATGAALAQLSIDGPRDLVFVDERHRVRVFRGKEELWTSHEAAGGSLVYAEIEKLSLGGQGTAVKQPYYFEPIPAVLDVEGDGIEEVFLVRNVKSLGFVPNLGLYSGGDIVLLRQERFGYTLSPISPRFNGVITGLVGLRGATPRLLIAVSRKTGSLIKKGETTIYLSRLR
jgi:hypothetical protein